MNKIDTTNFGIDEEDEQVDVKRLKEELAELKAQQEKDKTTKIKNDVRFTERKMDRSSDILP